MRLHSPGFEKTLRRGVRRAVRSSGELKREFRRANKYRRQYPIQLLVRPGISIGLAVLAWQMAEERKNAAPALALLNLWAFAFIPIHAQRMIACLFQSRDLTALSLLPVPARDVFQWQLQKFFRSALWSLLDLLAGYGALAAWMQFEPLKWLGVLPAALLAWGATLALAALGLIFLPRVPYFLVSNGLMLAIFFLFMARNLVGNALLLFLEQCAPVLNLVLPTGWPAELFQLLSPQPRWLALGLLVPTGGLIWTLRLSLARLRSNYQFGETPAVEPPDLVPGSESLNPLLGAQEENRPRRLGPTEIEEIVLSRQFMTPPGWQQRGWFEGWLWRQLNEREKALSEFVFPNGLGITLPWKRLFRNLGLTAVGVMLASRLAPGLMGWIWGAGLFVTGCQAVAQMLGTGRAFQSIACSGVNIPIYAVYGVGFRELGRLLFKVSLVQSPLLLPFSVLACLLGAYVTELPLAAAIPFGLKAAGLMLVSRFVFIVFAFSAGTNDTSSLRVRAAVLLGFVVFCCLLFAGLGGASLLLSDQFAAWGLWALAAADAYAFYRIYGWFYHANRFDLMSLPRR